MENFHNTILQSLSIICPVFIDCRQLQLQMILTCDNHDSYMVKQTVPTNAN